MGKTHRHRFGVSERWTKRKNRRTGIARARCAAARERMGEVPDFEKVRKESWKVFKKMKPIERLALMFGVETSQLNVRECPYCTMLGHNEDEVPCPKRCEDAKRFQFLGLKLYGKL